MPSLPEAILGFFAELLKHQARKHLGDGASRALADALTDYAGDTAAEKVTAFLAAGQHAEKLLAAFHQADRCFSRLSDPRYAQIIASKPLAALERLEQLARRFTTHLDGSALRVGIQAQLQADWGDAFPPEFYPQAARDYLLCLERALAATTRDLLPAIFAKVERIEEGVRLLDERTQIILDRLPPRQQAEAYRPAYLDFLIRVNRDLQLPDGRRVPLERVYVSLRADRMSPAERRAEHEAFLQDLESQLAENPPPAQDPYAWQRWVTQALKRNPAMTLLRARDWDSVFGARGKPQSRNLAEVVQAHPAVVLLGDPGSGKTTLGRWLTLQHARALQEGRATLQVPLDLVQPGADEPEHTIDLGPPRLPLFIRIAQYAAARWPSDAPPEGNDRTLEDFIARGRLDHRALPHDLPAKMVGALALRALEAGTALVILDGLDEVADLDQRRAVMETIHGFVQRWQPRGVRIVVTSRIVGYQFAPLTALPHYLIEEMDETAIRAFCRAWMGYFHPEAEAAGRGDALAQAIFEHGHPSVRSLAGNPLLLTLLAQVYRAGGERALPHRRVDLFAAVFTTLYERRAHLWQAQGVTEAHLARALGAVARYLHAHEPTGLTDGGTVRYCLAQVLEQPAQVDAVLRIADQGAGFLVSRGEKVYAFLHRALQEYFVARDLAARPRERGAPPLLAALQEHGLDPTWQEPLVLALGILHRSDYPLPRGKRHALQARAWETLLNLPDPAAAVLPRRALLAAAAFPECEEPPPEAVARRVAQALLTAYRPDSPKVLRDSIQRAFRALQNSSAVGVLENILVQAVQDPAFETRWAALDLLIETEWYASRAVLDALLGTWHQYAAPSGAMMVALYTFHEKHPEWLAQADLPFRQAVEADPALWQRAAGDATWRWLLTALYLAPWQDFTPQNIWRASPLTPQVLAALRADDVDRLRTALEAVPLDADDARGRDAALARIALGDESLWDAALPPMTARAWAGSLGFLSGRDFVRVFEFMSAHDFILVREFGLSSSITVTINSDFDFIHNITFNLARAFDLALTLANALVRTFTLAFNDYDLTRILESHHDLAWEFKTINTAVENAHFRWNKDPSFRATLMQEEANLQSFLLAEHLVYFLSLVRLNERFSPAERKYVKNPALNLTTMPLPDLVAALTAPDDARRQAARQALEKPPAASALGKAHLEALAALAAAHAADPRVGTALDWMLHRVKHDRPEWVRAWLDAAAQADDTPAAYLLRNLYKPDEAVARLLLDALPHESRRVNLVLLDALRWQADRASIPTSVVTGEVGQAFLPRLAAWLGATSDPDLATAIVNLLGHWRAAAGEAAAILLDLLARPGRIWDEGVVAVAQHALARLASSDEDLRPRVQALLEAALPASGPALARLLAARHRDASALLEALDAHLSDPTTRIKGLLDAYLPDSAAQIEVIVAYLPPPAALLEVLAFHLADPVALLAALLDAGADDDVWEDDYHGLLAAAVGAHAAAHPQVLPALLARLREALQGDAWPRRRMALAGVVAAIERVPAQVQRAAGGPAALEVLLLQGAQDAHSHDARRFALTGLSYLRAVTPRVVPVLLAALDENIAIVQHDAVQAASRFQRIAGDADALLGDLIPHLHGPRAAQAYGVAQLLAALALSPAGQAAGLRSRVVHALAQALQDPFAAQEVFVAERRDKFVNKGPLKEALYEALLRVAGWL